MRVAMRAFRLMHRLSIRIVDKVGARLRAATATPTSTPIRAPIIGNPFMPPLYLTRVAATSSRARGGATIWLATCALVARAAFIYIYTYAHLARHESASTNPRICQVRIAQNLDRFRGREKNSFDAPNPHGSTFPPHLCQIAQT